MDLSSAHVLIYLQLCFWGDRELGDREENCTHGRSAADAEGGEVTFSNFFLTGNWNVHFCRLHQSAWYAMLKEPLHLHPLLTVTALLLPRLLADLSYLGSNLIGDVLHEARNCVHVISLRSSIR